MLYSKTVSDLKDHKMHMMRVVAAKIGLIKHYVYVI